MCVAITEVEARLSSNLLSKFRNLVNWFRKCGGPIIIAFSGGVDSSVVLKVAILALGLNNVIAVTCTSPLQPPEDLEWARKVASSLGVRHVMIEVNVLNDPEFIRNTPDRCYHCKKMLIRSMKEVATRFGAIAVVDGTNASDLKLRRPGYRALLEENVKSPLAEVGVTKDEVRELARALELPNWNRPSMACLATRIPYGEAITLERLRRIAKAERIVKELTGVAQIRVRDHGYIARIEVGRDERWKFFNCEVMDRVARELMKLGYRYVTLDLLGYRSGSMDELLT
ncbi:MAG: ATP-dependent sacrificial sulfur transferase LarE [Thermoprotei archaeon]|nr:MAG: ATP-dependent sacrificial sulfur transferase LarE [Thermoprotei archaeon]